jgi:radical SAM superfamily enzyme YgiQ (UPF0313 family)
MSNTVILAKLEAETGSHSTPPPFGILYLASALEAAGFRVELLHSVGDSANNAALVRKVMAERPVFVGFSTLTGPSLLPTLEASREIRKANDVPIVWGGLHPTMLPEQTLQNTSIDVVAVGEGEETIVDLAKVLADVGVKPERLAEVQGIAFRENGVVRRTELRPFIRDLDRYAPAWHLLDAKRYFFTDRHFYTDMGSRLAAPVVASIITSRGCPWRCAYCYNQFVNRRSFRMHSPQRVLEDVRALRERYGVGAVMIEDDCFFADQKRGVEIVRGLGAPWNVSIRASEIVKWGIEFLNEIAASGCQEIRIGAESGSQNILDLMAKDITVSDIREAVKLCLGAGIRPCLNFMIGLPGETGQDMRKTLDLMDELEGLGESVAVNGPSVFLPWPGTALYDRAVSMGFKPPERTEDWAVQWGGRLPSTPFLPRKYKLINYYRFIAFRKETRFLRFRALADVLKRIALIRWRRRFFRLPLDYYLPRLGWRLLRVLGFRKLSAALYE